MSVVIETTIGDLTVDLFTDERPVACLNFLKLCKLKYYNYNLFHTIEQDFIAQTGDPSGVGNGGCSVWGVVEGQHKRFFEAEYIPKIHHTSAGLISLVSAGKNLVGSQFFITLGTNLTSLDGIHCVIGEVVEGHETLRKLNEAIVDEKFRPYQDVRITHTVILDDPFPSPRGFQIPSRSPSPTTERLQNGRIAADEDIDDTDGKSIEEIQEMLAEREAKARATILEIVGDLPDAEMAPPENVLFVCKLNPVTTDDDLEIIFSRFGKVKTCEVIRDKRSGDSLQYAFVEFEEQKSCEAAYFKMDNVLIDDRRIHVDFSQSVARVKWRGKGRGVEGPDGYIDFNNLNEKDSDSRSDRRRDGESRIRQSNERSRMGSTERRKARERRHQENDIRDAQRNRRSNSRGEQRNRETNINSGSRSGENYPKRRDYNRRGNSPSPRDRNRFTQNNRQRSRSRERRKEQREFQTTNRRISASRRDDRRRYSPERRQSPVIEDNTSRRRSNNESKGKEKSVDIRRQADLKRKKESNERKQRKRKQFSSSDSTSSSSESTTETSSSESSSSSDSDSSSDEHNKRKKSTKSKKKKTRKSKASKKTRRKK